MLRGLMYRVQNPNRTHVHTTAGKWYCAVAVVTVWLASCASEPLAFWATGMLWVDSPLWGLSLCKVTWRLLSCCVFITEALCVYCLGPWYCLNSESLGQVASHTSSLLHLTVHRPSADVIGKVMQQVGHDNVGPAHACHSIHLQANNRATYSTTAAILATSMADPNDQVTKELVTYLLEKGRGGLDFGVYNSLDYRHAVNGKGLANCRRLLNIFLEAGMSRLYVEAMRGILKDVGSKLPFPLNPRSDVPDPQFASFVTRRINLMFYHARRLLDPVKHNNCFSQKLSASNKADLSALIERLTEIKEHDPSTPVKQPERSKEMELTEDRGKNVKRRCCRKTQDDNFNVDDGLDADGWPKVLTEVQSEDGSSVREEAWLEKAALNRAGRIPGRRGD